MNKLFTFLLVILALGAKAQELNADVTVNFPKLQVADPAVLETLEQTLEEILNNTAWTDIAYLNSEKIECSFILNIEEELSETSFTAKLQIQASRPTYNSDYKTVTFVHVDKDVQFEFDQFSPIQFIENSYSSNMASILGFYAYTIIGIDQDSFSPNGGEDYFQKAQDIINTIPTNVAQQLKGWRSLDNNGTNRYWLIENLLNPRVADYRIAFYNYHRASLDIFAADQNAALITMTKSIEQMQEVNKAYINSMIIRTFVNSKSSEIVEIYKGAPTELKQRVYQAMIKMDPANASKYRVIRK